MFCYSFKCQNPVVEQTPNESSDSVFVSPPPYQPAPPYTPPKPRDSLPGQASDTATVTPVPTMDIPALTSSPRSGRAFGGQQAESPRSSRTPQRSDEGQKRLSGGYNSQSEVCESPRGRPTTLPLGPQHTLGPPTPRSGHIPDGRPQPMSNQSPRTPRSHQGHTPNRDKSQSSRTPGSGHDLAHSDFHLPLDGMNASKTPLDTPLRLTQYEKDVAVFKQVEPPSQVSSSTDSGYGHHIYEKMPGQGVCLPLSVRSS